MPIIDFKEIPAGNRGGNEQDLFEFFVRDFLADIGYEIIQGPSRGPDGGRDLVVQQSFRDNDGKVTAVRWLVSCKHFAHSKKGKNGRAVGVDDEINILERVESQMCRGFMGVYSTLASTGLSNRLATLSHRIANRIFDREQIESLIVGFHAREQLFLRYFEKSYIEWKSRNYYTEPVPLFNFYFEKTYGAKFQGLVNYLFGASENLIKPLRSKLNAFRIFREKTPIVILDELQTLLVRQFQDLPIEKYIHEHFDEILTLDGIPLRALFPGGISLVQRNETVPPIITSPTADNEPQPSDNQLILVNVDLVGCETFALLTDRLIVTTQTGSALKGMVADLRVKLQVA